MDAHPWHRHPFFPAAILVLLMGLAGAARWSWEAWLRPPPEPPADGSVEVPWIRINEALPHEIAAIPGIGPATARAIVRDRRANGPFRSAEDLDRVPGVGPATIAKMAPYLGYGGTGDGKGEDGNDCRGEGLTTGTPPPPRPSP